MGDKEKRQKKEQKKLSKKDLKLIGKIGKDAFYELKAKETEATNKKLQETEDRVLKELGYDNPKQETIPKVAEAPAPEMPAVQVNMPEAEEAIPEPIQPKKPVIAPQRDSSLPREPLVKTVDKPELVIEITAPAESIKVEAPKIVPREKTKEKEETRGEKKKMTEKEKFKGFSLPLEELAKRNQGNGTVNAAYGTETGMSLSTHYPLIIKGDGEIIRIVILPATMGRRPRMKKLPEKEVGKWTQDKVENWEAGIFYGKIAHCNLISPVELDLNKPIVGYALISAKEVTQSAGRQVFHHIIVIPDENVMPAFELSINNISERDDDEIVVGPTVGALYDDKEVKEYLHLKKI